MHLALTADPELPVPPRLYGGIERVVDILARGLLERGHQVTLFAHPNSSSPARLRPWPGKSSSSRLDTVRNSITLAKATALEQFDIIHSFSRMAYLTPVLPSRVPKLMTYQRPISPRSIRLARRLGGDSIEFTAISEWMIRDVSKSAKWHIVPNGVPLDRYTPSSAVASDAPLVFVGRIEEIKGPHLAIEIAKRTGRRLVIAGNIPEDQMHWFERHVAPAIDDDSVRYIGPVDDAQKNDVLGAASAFLMPILWDEPFGIVMAEAMACGTPVIGFRRGAVPEVVVDGVTGFVVDDVDGAVLSFSRIDSIDRRACREHVERLYGDAVLVENYLRTYAGLLSRAGT